MKNRIISFILMLAILFSCLSLEIFATQSGDSSTEAVMGAVALLWIISYDRLTVGSSALPKQAELPLNKLNNGEKRTHKSVYYLIFVLAFFAVANNFIKDGLTAWTPDILKYTYNPPDWLSILLTLLLPTLGILGAVLALNVQKITKNFVMSVTLLFAVSAVLIGAVLALLSSASALAVTVAIFAIVACLMTGVNSIITSQVPLSLKAQGNSGKIAGILNGLCYLGSTLSYYGLGFIAERSGWGSVFVTLVCISVFVVVIGTVFVTVKKLRKDA